MGTGCNGQALSSIGLIGPTFTLVGSNASVTPTQATGSYDGGNCGHSNVAGCIPGYGCGSPNILLTSGGNTVPAVVAGTPLWTTLPPASKLPPSPPPIKAKTCEYLGIPALAYSPMAHQQYRAMWG